MLRASYSLESASYASKRQFSRYSQAINFDQQQAPISWQGIEQKLSDNAQGIQGEERTSFDPRVLFDVDDQDDKMFLSEIGYANQEKSRQSNIKKLSNMHTRINDYGMLEPLHSAWRYAMISSLLMLLRVGNTVRPTKRITENKRKAIRRRNAKLAPPKRHNQVSMKKLISEKSLKASVKSKKKSGAST